MTSDPDDLSNHFLAITMSAMVPLAVAELLARGGPDDLDWETTRAFADDGRRAGRRAPVQRETR